MVNTKKTRKSVVHKFNYVYKISHKDSKKYYIGMHCTDNMDDGYMGSGTLIKRAYKKYGKDRYYKTTIAQLSSEAEAFELEARLVTAETLKDPNCYNLKVGGEGGGEGNCEGLKLARQVNIDVKIARDIQIDKVRQSMSIGTKWNTKEVVLATENSETQVKSYWKTRGYKAKDRSLSAMKEAYAQLVNVCLVPNPTQKQVASFSGVSLKTVTRAWADINPNSLKNKIINA